MRSDALFYELFQAAPWTFFELMQLTPPCPYRFESITVKTTEKRIDGVLEPEQAGERIYFLEVQAQPDVTIYWRTLREVATYFEQRPQQPDNWQAVVLYLNITDDPGFSSLSPLAKGADPRLVAADILDLLKQLTDDSLVLNVLRPLVTISEKEVRQNVITWANNIQQLPGLSYELKQRLVTILAQLVMQKFARLTYKELGRMLRLIPLEETIDGKELIHDHNVKILLKLIRKKFVLTEAELESITDHLNQLDAIDQGDLIEDVLEIETLDELVAWLEQRVN
ncbi:MAG: DUF2887 domain-containing protein [Chloroflexi bacterium]|nr:DUF2887 domain-containing protein [Chloroflexota bacterium]MBP8056247.1 DUF2887 domain-containing protein [Chloroflexota bacterium]